MSETPALNWAPVNTAPYQQVIWVRNSAMDKPIKATRGYVIGGAVHPNQDFFTSVLTEDEIFPFPSGRLVCPTEWAAIAKHEDVKP